MSWALGFLVMGIMAGAIAVVLNSAVERDPTPSVSGYIVPLVICAIAAPCLLLLALATWIVSVTMAVL